MSRYSSLESRQVEGKTIVETTIYESTPLSEQDIYVISSVGDRFDILAKEFYSRQDYWWIISAANPEVRKDTMFITPGIQLRIPPLKEAIKSYEQVNKNR